MDAALQEIRALQDHFLLLGRRLALEKTAAFLVLLLGRLSEPLGKFRAIRLPMNRTDIADYLGLTPETVSRSFTELRGRRALALDDANTVIVLDPAQLRAIAEGAVEAWAGALAFGAVIAKREPASGLGQAGVWR
jgi:CRP-like cAMP-binding protein